MTAARDDLSEVNAALRELVRLQLAGELPAQEAWHTRRQMLNSVEAAWNDLRHDLTPEALASKQVLKAPVPLRQSLFQRLQQRPTWSWHLPRLQLALPTLRWPTLHWRPLFSALAHLPWWPLFLLAALATFYYVSTL